MRILVTNDDGIESEGIHVLARALASTEHEVVVVAPDRNWSGVCKQPMSPCFMTLADASKSPASRHGLIRSRSSLGNSIPRSVC